MDVDLKQVTGTLGLFIGNVIHVKPKEPYLHRSSSKTL